MEIGSFTTLNLAILVLALGRLLTRRVKVLQEFNIPEPVTSGLLASLLTAALYFFARTTISFDLAIRDLLLLYFFAGIGLNSDFKTLRAGGKPLAVLVALTVGYIFLQNFAGIGVAAALGLNPLIGLLGGSVSLLGGHGTSIAWSPIFAGTHGIEGAGEIGIACATLGLVISSLLGGPVARLLIKKKTSSCRPLPHPMSATATATTPSARISAPTACSRRFFGLISAWYWANCCRKVFPRWVPGCRFSFAVSSVPSS